MSRPKKILAIVAASIAGLVLAILLATIVIVQTPWFANFVREKIVASIEESTGGKVEVGSFQFDPWHLTVRIRNFVLHGTEPRTVHPLASVALLEIHLKLLSGIAHAVDLAYIGVQQPRVNLIVFPDGKTNVPEPKAPKTSSNSNGLQTIVDLKIGEFQIQDGLIQFAQQATAFSGHGENLHALLNYNSLNPGYSGNLAIAPLLLSQGNRPPLRMDVNVPVVLQGDAVQVSGAAFGTGQSKIVLNASLRQMAAPVVDAKVNVDLDLPELQRSVALPIDTTGRGIPQRLTAELAAHIDEKSNTMQLQTAHLQLGKTTLEASGPLRDPANPTGAVQFNANLAVDELSRLLKVTSPEASGAVIVNGNARLDAQSNYQVNGTIHTKDLAVREDGTNIDKVSLTTPFHADPYLISLDGLKMNALGGSLGAKIFVEKLRNVSVEGTLRNFSLPVLAAVFTGKHLGYDGAINGGLKAQGDLEAKGTTGYRAQANLAITPGTRGVPVQGKIAATYNGANGLVDLGDSYVALPHSRLDLAGALNQRIDLKLVSHNLNDFLPAANFGATKPATSLPVQLQPGGAATVTATITGNLSDPNVNGHAAINSFALQQSTFDQLSVDLAASPSHVAIQNGSLTRQALNATFDAAIGLRKWSPVPRSPLTANVSMHNASVTDLLSMAGESTIPATGNLGAEVHIHGTYGDPLGTAVVQVANGSAYNEPFNRLLAQINLADRLITLAPLELATDAGNVDVNATYRHPRDSFLIGDAQVHVTSATLDLSKLKQLQSRSPGLAGTIHLAADAAASVREVNKQTAVDVSNVNADVSARALHINHQTAGDLTLTARTSNRIVNYQLTSDLAGSNINISGKTNLATDYPTTATANIQKLSIEKVLALAGQSTIPAKGMFAADAHVTGTAKSPRGDLTFSLADANVYQERINRLAGTVHYADTLVDLPTLELDTPAGRVTLAASFNHPANTFTQGSIKLNVNSTPIDLTKIQHVQEAQPTLTGTLRLAADVSANLRQHNGSPELLLTRANADAGAYDLNVNHRRLGQAVLNAKTAGTAVAYHFDSDIAQSQIHANGTTQLSGDYPTDASLTFRNIRYANLAPFLSDEPTVRPAFDALVEGQASVKGPALNLDKLSARLQLDRLEAQTSPLRSPTGAPNSRVVTIQNKGPIVVALNRSILDIEQLHLGGPGTTINAQGTVNLKDKTAPIDVKTDANLDLSILEDADRDFYSKGAVTFNAAVHGTFAQPLVNGRIELKNANINYASVPNGLSNANGVILLTGTGANIQSLTGESGGGKISVTGFAGFSGRAITYNLKAAANQVRVRYSGISVTSNAAISLIGNTYRSLVSGTVTINRIAYNSSSDAGSLLSSFAATPPSTPSAPSPILAGMRLAIRVTTAPDLRVVTTYAERLAVEANLTVRGTPVTPGIVGRVVITDGQLVFFGNTYTVNTGVINLYNPTSIQPIINISLETLAQGVDVTLGVSGPMDNLQLSYTSDPPLSFEQIVQLLATNTTPNDPNVTASQPPAQQQSFTQMGESAVLGQAVANPLASRVQRVFGLSQFKIDPSIAGSNGPSARVTLQQKIANNITFTYITDVTQTNSEIVRVQWDLTPKFSAVGLRDYNGNVSIEFFYQFKVR